MKTTKIRDVGGSKGIILPKKLIINKGWDGDTELVLIPFSDGIYMVAAEFFNEHKTDYEKDDLYHQELMKHVLSDDKTIMPFIMPPVKQEKLQNTDEPSIVPQIIKTPSIFPQKSIKEIEEEIKQDSIDELVEEEVEDVNVKNTESPIIYRKLVRNPNVEVVIPKDLFF